MFIATFLRCKHTLALIFPLLIFFTISSVYADTPSGIMHPGDAAVTAFSLTVPQSDPKNENIIDLNGPSMRVISLPGAGPFGLVDATKPFTATASSVGQVFGITLDDKPQPDIFVAATSAYGLGIYIPGQGRIQQGAPGAQFIPGQFGPSAQSGGPASIWRIDGQTGNVTLFATVTTNGISNAPASLGGLAFDSATQQIFVSDRTTGLIHRFSLDGTDNGVYDHGVQGLTTVGENPVPFDPATVADITSPNFDTSNPDTWGYAPLKRRVFALAVHDNRLYYSVTGPQVWSVGINNDGSFASDTRFEVDSPAAKPDIEISSISFDNNGIMYIAERGAPTGDYNFMSIADGGRERVKRFAPQASIDTAPALWTSPGDEYAIGMTSPYKNADGGVDLTCGRNVWSTGERLIDAIDGLQGNDVALVKPANMPPTQSWFINYYDHPADPNSRGHMGAIVILKACGGYALPPITTGFTCPVGTFLVDGACLIPPSCPNGMLFRDGYCFWRECPWGFVRINHHCVRPPIFCPYGTVFYEGNCVPLRCPRGLEQTRYGYCHCSNYSNYRDGRCLPPPVCPRNYRYRDGICVPPRICPFDQKLIDGRCKSTLICPRDKRYANGRCLPLQICPKDQKFNNGHCVSSKTVKRTATCTYGQHNVNGHCVSNSGKTRVTTPLYVNPKHNVTIKHTTKRTLTPTHRPTPTRRATPVHEVKPVHRYTVKKPHTTGEIRK